MKNGSMTGKLAMQEKEISFSDEKKNKKTKTQNITTIKVDSNTSLQRQTRTKVDKQSNSDLIQSANQSNSQGEFSSLFSILPSVTDISPSD